MQLRSRRHGQMWWCSRSLETAQLLDLLVILDADNATLAGRLRGRSKEHHADVMPAGSLNDYLGAERQACHAVADVLAREGTEVHRVVTSETGVDEQVQLVREWVDRNRDRHPQHAP